MAWSKAKPDFNLTLSPTTISKRLRSGQPTAEYQAHAGAVDRATTPKVQYGYANGSANTTRRTEVVYPDGRTLTYDYGDGLDDALSRVRSLKQGSTVLRQYTYLGSGLVVRGESPPPQLKMDLATGSAADPYAGLDRFNRVVDLLWRNDGTSTDAVKVQYGYDRVGNRLWRRDPVDATAKRDELYQYDGLYRLTSFRRGDLNAARNAVSTLRFAQQWALDPTGNWAGFKQDDNGDGTWDLDQTRAATKANEISSIGETAGPEWADPRYDAAGNMDRVPAPDDPTTLLHAEYDAWNRLVRLTDGVNPVAEYAYDGWQRRTAKRTYAAGVLAQTRHFYYSDDWQTLEERVGAATTAERQFVWGLDGADDLVLRDRDANGDGTLEERLYALQDAALNVTAVADAAGAVVERYGYQAYGQSEVLTPAYGVRPASLYDWETRFTGYRRDAESGLYQVRHRYHHPRLGAWLTRDPIGYNAGDMNLYRYVANNPATYADPSGLGYFDTAWAALGGFAEGLG
ncbi:MAG: RHS repeat-associated core domain-containing protein, partial [Planctomycetia bacterium]